MSCVLATFVENSNPFPLTLGTTPLQNVEEHAITSKFKVDSKICK